MRQTGAPSVRCRLLSGSFQTRVGCHEPSKAIITVGTLSLHPVLALLCLLHILKGVLALELDKVWDPFLGLARGLHACPLSMLTTV